MRRVKWIAGIVSIGVIGLLVHHQFLGRSAHDLVERAEAAFIARARLRGCSDPKRTLISPEQRYTTHYGARLPSVDSITRKYFERLGSIQAHPVGDAEVISFPGGGEGCYDNIFVPISVQETSGDVVDEYPAVLRIAQREPGYAASGFFYPEILGFWNITQEPCPAFRGRIPPGGVVPPAREALMAFGATDPPPSSRR